MYIYKSFVNAESSARDSEVPPVGTRSPPISGPRPSFFARSRRGFRSRPPPGLSLRARSRGRAPPPSRATLNCARFDGSWRDGETKKVLRNSKVLLLVSVIFASTFTIPPGEKLFLAAISACRQASISLRSLGLAVATAFLLSTTSLAGSPFASLTPYAFPRWDTSTVLTGTAQARTSICTAQNSAYCIRYLFYISRVNYSFLVLLCTTIENDTITAAALSST